jgi:hypothetical protein
MTTLPSFSLVELPSLAHFCLTAIPHVRMNNPLLHVTGRIEQRSPVLAASLLLIPQPFVT